MIQNSNKNTSQLYIKEIQKVLQTHTCCTKSIQFTYKDNVLNFITYDALLLITKIKIDSPKVDFMKNKMFFAVFIM